ncbi:MAG: metallophosphoesterase [Acidocella sp.]|nr:metallophosphoesterase [Acidocella sp.]
MIRILYMSDLHLEMERWQLRVPGWERYLARHRAIAKHPARGPLLNGLGSVDLVVLAGDIHNGLRGIVYAEQVAAYLAAPVVYVAGNHEFYHHDIARLLPACQKAAPHSEGQVRFLERGVARYDIRGQRVTVLGCTMWTDYDLTGDRQAAMRVAKTQMNDHALIRLGRAVFTPDDARARHLESRLWLHKTLARLTRDDPAARNIIVTHHAPGAGYLGARVGGIAPAYASDMVIEFASLRPAAWVHGHTHFTHNSVAEGMRIMSAPRGYVTEGAETMLDYKPGILEI